MPTLVMLGSGAIGRGFVAPLFAAAGWEAVLADIDRELVAALDQRGSYRLRLVAAAGEQVQTVAVASALDAADHAGLTAALAICDLAATAVGLKALPAVARPIAAALCERRRSGRGALDVLLCENGPEAATILREAVLAALPASERDACAGLLGCVRATIGRMVPPPGREPDLAAEGYAHLPVERAAFRGPIPSVPGLEPVADFALAEALKLHVHNLTHAALAFHGLRRGLATVADAMADAAVRGEAAACADEVIAALGISHGPAAAAEARALADGLMERYRNPLLADPLLRVARDPWRKLAPDDRLVGAARRCLAAGVPPTAICRAIAAALLHRVPAGEAGGQRWREHQEAGPAALLAAVAGPLPPAITGLVILACRRERLRSEAVLRLRAAGIVVARGEESAIELADFGLQRFEELGLAILVYVNTARCCAKELAMLPGQVCPEHRHPMVDGAPGKEETFRVRQGSIDLFLPGDGDRAAALRLLPADARATVSVFHRVHLGPGEQCTLPPDTRHWFVAGPEGAVVSEFSTRSRDEADVFTDPAIVRVPA